MTYKNKELRRKTTNERVKRFREKQKSIVPTDVCPACNGKKYIIHQGMEFPCPTCKKK